MKLICEHWKELFRSVLVIFGAIFLVVEGYEVLTDNNVKTSFFIFLIIGIVPGLIFFLIDGYKINGFLRHEVNIPNPSSKTKISVKYGDLFAESGWKAIGVNDFFDSKVDEDLISSNSLHGIVINTYWKDNQTDWEKKVSLSLNGKQSQKENRSKGNELRYPIGTTARASAGGHNFLFVALGETNIDNNVTSASASMLLIAVRGMLKEARAACSAEPLIIPLMGSGLARVGIKDSVLLDLIITAILEEDRDGQITKEIIIVIHNENEERINLKNNLRNWTRGK